MSLGSIRTAADSVVLWDYNDWDDAFFDHILAARQLVAMRQLTALR